MAEQGPRVSLADWVAAGERQARSALERLFAPATVGPSEQSFESEEAPALAAAFELEGAPEVKVAFVSPVESARALCETLLKRPAADFDPRAREAFTELGNIVASAFLNGIAAVSGSRLVPTVPAAQELSVAALLESFGTEGERSVSPFEVRLEAGPARGLLVAALAPRSIDRLLEALSESSDSEPDA